MAKHSVQIQRDEHDVDLNAKRMISAATVYAVVNTAAAGQASVVLDAGNEFIGLATTVVANPTDIGLATVSLQAGTDFIGLISAASIHGSVSGVGTFTVDATGAGDVPITLGGEAVVLGAGTDYIGLASINIGGTLPALTAGSAFIGLISAASIHGNVSGVGTFTVDATGAGDVPITLGGEAVVLGAGTATYGKLAANSGIDIGDVDILSIAAGDNNIGNVDVVTMPELTSLATVTQSGALPAGANYIGLASVNVGNIVLADVTGQGDVPITLGGEAVVLGAGSAGIGKLTTNTGVDIGDVDVTSITGVTMSNAAIQTTGDEAHDAPDAGNPVKIGGKAKNFDGTAPGTAVLEDDRTDFINDVYGRQFVETTHPNLWDVSADYAVAQTNTSVKVTPGASLKLYITDIMISNGATAGNITLLDGSGGTVLFEIYPAVTGGAVVNLKTPIALTANTALVITSTTVTTHSVFVSGYIAA